MSSPAVMFSRWLNLRSIFSRRSIHRARGPYLLFALYLGTAALWLWIGLMPVAVSHFPPLRAWFADLRASAISSAHLVVLVQAIYFASFAVTQPAAIVAQYAFSVANIGMSILLIRLRPQDRVAWLLAIGLVGTGAIFNMQSHVLLDSSGLPWLSTLHELLHLISGVAYALALLLFPTGTLPPSPFPKLRLSATLDWPLRILLLLGFSIFGWLVLLNLHGDPWTFVTVFGVVIPITGGVAQLFRYRRAMAEAEREQTRTLLFALLAGLGVALLCLGGVVLTSDLSSATERALARAAFVIFPLLFTFIPLSLTFIVLRYRMWELKLVINRSLIYGILTGLIIAFYALILFAVDTFFQTQLPWVPSAIAVALAAILAQPLREWVQTGVNRLMYGDREDPFGVLARLGDRLEATAHSEDVLPVIAETVARTLKLPYVAVAVKEGERFTPVAAYGNLVEAQERFPLVDQGEVVGQLWVAVRTPGEPFHRADRRLLQNLARQAGPAVHAVLLASALQRSRLRLVTAREEERRRLRRDLHDGLGPQLASVRLKIDAVRNHLHRDPAQSERLLNEVKDQIAAAMADVRRTVYGLRPPTLDQLGLVSAIREHVRTLGEQSSLQITVVGPDAMPPLPAAIEVVAYHLILEGLTNVLRHAQAGHAYVGICLSGALHIVVADDGIGLPTQAHEGVGLTSMRERVAEVGGRLTFTSTPGVGTRIEASLPLLEQSCGEEP